MDLVYLLLGLAGLVWLVLVLRYHDIVVGAALFLAVASTLSSDFVKLELGGASLTFDRLWLACLCLQLAYNWKTSRLQIRSLASADVFLILFLVWLVVRTLMHPLGELLPEQPSTVMHLLNGYLIPAFIYFLIRWSRVDESTIRPAIIVLMIFGVYLSCTAIFEVAKLWALVYPKFIADPELGIHFGRARGPMLQSVRLGVCLTLALGILWISLLWANAHRRYAWGIALALTPLFLLAILLTYTRSIWMGAAAILVICLAFLLRGRMRAVSLGGLAVCTLVGGLIVGPNLVAFKREYSEAETRESTYMRAAFTYVSWKMFLDRPIIGHGFNQFQVYNRPYLDDRTTDIRLESIRGYVHHNSYASILVDLGMIGGVLFALTAAGFLRSLWHLWSNRLAPNWARANAVLALCVMAVHAIQMAFHEVSFSPIENTILAMSLGLAQSCRDDFRTAGSVGWTKLAQAWHRQRKRIQLPSPSLNPNFK